MLIIIIAALIALGVVRYVVTHQDEIDRGVRNFSPEKVERGVLGVISRIGKKGDDSEAGESKAPAAIQLIEEKAGDLLEELKKLPEEKVKSVKQQVLKEVCEGVIEEEEKEE